MNDGQRKVLIIAGLLGGMMLLFPPMRTEAFKPPWMNEGNEEVVTVSAPVRYAFILHDGFSYEETGVYLSTGLHWPRLRLQFMILVLAAVIMLSLLRGGDDDDGSSGGDGHAPDGTPPGLPQLHVQEVEP